MKKPKRKQCCVRHCTKPVHAKLRCSKHYRMYLKTRKKKKKHKIEQQQDVKDFWSCDICCDKYKTVVFQCGHRTCSTCSEKIHRCPYCKELIMLKINMY